MACLAEEQLEAIAFTGETLASFFLENPQTQAMQERCDAFRALDAVAAACDWPFGDTEELVAAFADICSGLEDERPDQLAAEFERLFAGPGHKVVPPWGSVYTDHDRVMFGKSTLKLRAWMRQRGIKRLADDKSPDDHIGLMLYLMAWLAQHRPVDLPVFVTEHLASWWPMFCERLIEQTTSRVYRGAGRLTYQTLDGICEMCSGSSRQ